MHQEAVSPLVRDAIAMLREHYGDRLLHLAVRAPAPGAEEFDDLAVSVIVVLDGTFNWGQEVIAMGPIAGAISLKSTSSVPSCLSRWMSIKTRIGSVLLPDTMSRKRSGSFDPARGIP